MTTKRLPNEMTITRVYDAPVKLVWDAWTDPKQAAKWWGPRGFTITTHSKNLKPGGVWHYTMHGPDGVDWPNKAKYFEVEKHSKLVYDHGGNDEQAPLFKVTVLFSESKGKTTMEMTMAFSTAEVKKETEKMIVKAGGNSTWDRLAEYLERENSKKEIFVINRTFMTSVENMYEMWTNPEHFSKWLAPTGFNMTFIRSDIRPGGSTFYYMDGAGPKMYGRANYLEMKKPNRIKYTQEFCDEKENLTRHPMAPTWPATMMTTVDLVAESSNETRVTVTWEVTSNYTKEEMDTFIAAKGGMTQGWTGSFDKLEGYLER